MAIFIGWLIGSLIGNIIVLAMKIVVYSIKWTAIILYHIAKGIWGLIEAGREGARRSEMKSQEYMRNKLAYEKQKSTALV